MTLFEQLVKFGNSFRNILIADDDFPAKRDRFDKCLRDATKYLEDSHQPNSIGYVRRG